MSYEENYDDPSPPVMMSSEVVKEQQVEEEPIRVNCMGVFCTEFSPFQPWYKVKEVSSGRTLDVPESFGPWGLRPLLYKIVTCGFIISTQVYSWMETPKPSYYYAYYTSWALVFAFLYAITSFLNTVLPPSQPEGPTVQWRIKYTWTVFIMAVFTEALATVIFWSLVYDGGVPSYLDITSHGVVFGAVMIDGFIINRIPIRWMFMWAWWIFTGLFLIWSVLQGPLVFDIGNPNESDNDPETNDDAIYASLSWTKDDAKGTAVTVSIVYFVVMPIIFMIIRALANSNLCCCPLMKDRLRYVATDADLNVQKSHDESVSNNEDEAEITTPQVMEEGVERVVTY